jgi:hypothetical protein
MNKNEFKIWQGFHEARFPNWASWLANMDRPDSALSGRRGEVLAAMFESLADVSLADAKEATARLARGDEPEIDQLEQHARAVRTVARRLSSERIKVVLSAKRLTREPTYHCPRCFDEGLLTVWHPETVRFARSEEGAAALRAQSVTTYACAVACECRAGDGYAANGWKRLNTFMLVLPDGLDRANRIEEMIAFANRPDRHEWNPETQMDFT